VRGGEVWVGVEFGHPEPAAYWRQRLHVGSVSQSGGGREAAFGGARRLGSRRTRFGVQ
jgi:hypothetical protein